MCRKMWLCRAQTIIHRMRKNNGHETSNNISFTLQQRKWEKREKIWENAVKLPKAIFYFEAYHLIYLVFLVTGILLFLFPSSMKQHFIPPKRFCTQKTQKRSNGKWLPYFPRSGQQRKKGQTFFMKTCTVKIRVLE